MSEQLSWMSSGGRNRLLPASRLPRMTEGRRRHVRRPRSLDTQQNGRELLTPVLLLVPRNPSLLPDNPHPGRRGRRCDLGGRLGGRLDGRLRVDSAIAIPLAVTRPVVGPDWISVASVDPERCRLENS